MSSLKDWLDLLACPACPARPPLRLEADESRLACPACGRSYRVEDGIPVLLVEEAT